MKIPPRKNIRPGQRHPYRKGTRAEIDQRRGAVLRLLTAGARKMEIHRFVKSQFNRLWRTADRDVAFVSNPEIGKITRLARVRAEHSQKGTDEMLEKLRFIYGDNTK